MKRIVSGEEVFCVFKIGDKILYPMNGAGIIESMEEKSVLGKTHTYFVMKMPFEDIKVMLPADVCDEIGVRFIISENEGKKVLEQFRKEPIADDEFWNKRHRDNMIKIKSGDIYQVLTVVKNLMIREKRKGLSTSERKMLGVSKQIFVSELVLCGAADKSDVDSIMEDCVAELL